jgi:Domain of unknown function (DUF4156)
MRAIILAALMLTATGCAGSPYATLSPAGERVRVTRNPNHVATCTSLGELSYTTLAGLLVNEKGYDNNRRALQNEAARRGADTVLILGERGDVQNVTFGEAYRCGEP